MQVDAKSAFYRSCLAAGAPDDECYLRVPAALTPRQFFIEQFHAYGGEGGAQVIDISDVEGDYFFVRVKGAINDKQRNIVPNIHFLNITDLERYLFPDGGYVRTAEYG